MKGNTSLFKKMSLINFRNIRSKYIVFAHVVIFMIFLSFLSQENLSGPERLTTAFLLGMMLTYGMTENLRQSVGAGILFVFVAMLLDPRGLFMDVRRPYETFVEHLSIDYQRENFDEKEKKEEDDDMKKVGSTETHQEDNLNMEDEDLDQFLKEDDKNDKEENMENQEETFDGPKGGGIDQLKKLLEQAKADGKAIGPGGLAKKEPRQQYKLSEKIDFNTISPAQAQRETYHLIDSVKQLKEMLGNMAPALSSAKQVMDMYKDFKPPESLS